ncbi:MAG: hypothetical protein ACPLXL_01780 [Minisyncoccia bacterium]
MKRSVSLRIAWFLIGLFLIWQATGCQSLFAPPVNIQLSEEENQILIEHSFNPPYIVRWPDGAVITVYDETNFIHLDYVLNEWNKCLEGKVTLVKTDNPNGAKVKIIYEESGGDWAGTAFTYYNWDNIITSGLIKIDKNYGYEIDTYLHEFGHVLGCHQHLEKGLMGGGGNSIDDYTCWFFRLLYSLPIGYSLK